jgi:nicotinamidase-related amidase
MPIPRLRIDQTALLVVDVQKRLMPTIFEADRMVRNCVILVRMAEALGLPTIVTEQNPRGLGPTVAPLKQSLGNSAPIEKTQFSACAGEVVQQLQAANRSTVLICGIEAHVCVLQTALDLHARGMQAFLVSDAISAGQPEQIRWAFERMQRAGAIVTGVVSAMYELMQGSTHPAFRMCLTLAKEATSAG